MLRLASPFADAAAIDTLPPPSYAITLPLLLLIRRHAMPLLRCFALRYATLPCHVAPLLDAATMMLP